MHQPGLDALRAREPSASFRVAGERPLHVPARPDRHEFQVYQPRQAGAPVYDERPVGRAVFLLFGPTPMQAFCRCGVAS